jgi:hypothetical protein
MKRDVDALSDDQWERLRDLVPGWQAGSTVRAAPTDVSSMRCCGWRVRADGGVICPNASALIRR